MVTVVLLMALVVTALVLELQPEPGPQEGTSSTGRATSADLYCLEFSRFSGAFVEDGTNEPVTNVAAALIENRSREFLDRATVTYDVGGRTAEFVVTGLPPGAKAWVLESHRMRLDGSPEFKFRECTSSFRQNAVLTTELLSLSAKGNTLTVRNESDQILENVCIYYKTLNPDGAYLGGITYMIAFDTLRPGDVAEKTAAHFSEDARVVRYSYQSG